MARWDLRRATVHMASAVFATCTSIVHLDTRFLKYFAAIQVFDKKDSIRN